MSFVELTYTHVGGFPGSSTGKEPTCNSRNPTSIPGSGSSPGKGIGYPLQYSWTFLVAQMVKNAGDQVRSLGQEEPLEKRNGYPTQYSCLENSMDIGVWQATVHETAKS